MSQTHSAAAAEASSKTKTTTTTTTTMTMTTTTTITTTTATTTTTTTTTGSTTGTTTRFLNLMDSSSCQIYHDQSPVHTYYLRCLFPCKLRCQAFLGIQLLSLFLDVKKTNFYSSTKQNFRVEKSRVKNRVFPSHIDYILARSTIF